jgi:Polyketide cyclase / dehydrase and lipid transport/Protein of unknown function (DUF2934)
MGSTTHSIEVNAPLRVVYNQWTQFEEFPRFMEGVDEVRQDGPKRLFWKATIAGKDKRWEAEIIEQVPDQRIAWVSVDGTPNAGEVSFESLEAERTLITLTMQYEPEGFLEKAGDVLGIPSGHVEGNLQRFREFIEQTGKETGGWRGSIGEETMGSNASPARQGEAGGIYEAYSETIKVPSRESSVVEEIQPEKDDTGADRITAERGESFQTAEQPSKVADHPAHESTPLATERRVAQEIPQFYRSTTEPTQEKIARRAYEIYLARGGAPGDARSDWFEAEKELSEAVNSR